MNSPRRSPPPTVPEAFLRELALRAPIRERETDALRLVDRGAFGDWALEDFAGHWLVQTRDTPPPPWLPAAAGAAGARSLHRKCLGEKSPPQPLWGEPPGGPFPVREEGLRFLADFSSGYSQGIFLDQRANRARVRQLAAAEPGRCILNTFAYTCAFGVAAAAGGAETANIDLSGSSLDWGRANYRENGIDPDAHGFYKGDAFDWLRRFAKKGLRFGGVILDPPTFSRDAKGRIFTVETRYGELAAAAAALLDPGGWLLCTTNQESLSPEAFARILRNALPTGRAWRTESSPLPPDFPGSRHLKTLWALSLP